MQLTIHNYNHPDAATRLLLSKILRKLDTMATQAEFDLALHGLTDNISDLKLAVAQDRADLGVLTRAINDFLASAPADLDISGLVAAVAEVGTIKPEVEAMDAELVADAGLLAPSVPPVEEVPVG